MTFDRDDYLFCIEVILVFIGERLSREDFQSDYVLRRSVQIYGFLES